jgi:hypothetical protein
MNLYTWDTENARSQSGLATRSGMEHPQHRGLEPGGFLGPERTPSCLRHLLAILNTCVCETFFRLLRFPASYLQLLGTSVSSGAPAL